MLQIADSSSYYCLLILAPGLTRMRSVTEFRYRNPYYNDLAESASSLLTCGSTDAHQVTFSVRTGKTRQTISYQLKKNSFTAANAL